jgi:hypothetical protein
MFPDHSVASICIGSLRLKHSTFTGKQISTISTLPCRDIQRETLLAKVLEFVDLEIRGAGWAQDKLLSVPTGQTPWQTTINQWDFLSQHGVVPWLRKIQAKSLPRVSDQVFEAFVKPQPDQSEYVQILQQSLITLGINRYPSFSHPFHQPDTYSRMRDIEAPMMGACYLTEWTEGLEDLYDLEQEIEIYRTPEEMIEKIKFLQGNPTKRFKMRFHAQRRALSEHSISNSIDKICSALNLSSKVSPV